MQAEREPVRFARLQRRNALASGRTLDELYVFGNDVTRATGAGADAIREDLWWLQDVDLGLWTPAPDFSNCLVIPSPEVTLWLLWHDAMQSFAMPRDGSEIQIELDRPQLNNTRLQAAGGPVGIQWWGGKELIIPDDGRTFIPHWPDTALTKASLVVRRYAGELR